jgi:hypothetical protein
LDNEMSSTCFAARKAAQKNFEIVQFYWFFCLRTP